jgi:hypothetical protein
LKRYEILKFQGYFCEREKKKKPWTRSTSRGPRPTRALASGRSGSPALSGDNQGGGEGHRGLTLGLNRAQEAVEWRHDDDEGGGGGVLRAQRESKEGWGRSGEERKCQGALLYDQRGSRVADREGEGNWAAGGGAPLWPSGLVGRGNEGGDWGVKRGGECCTVFRKGGDAEEACAC